MKKWVLLILLRNEKWMEYVSCSFYLCGSSGLFSNIKLLQKRLARENRPVFWFENVELGRYYWTSRLFHQIAGYHFWWLISKYFTPDISLKILLVCFHSNVWRCISNLIPRWFVLSTGPRRILFRHTLGRLQSEEVSSLYSKLLMLW